MSLRVKRSNLKFQNEIATHLWGARNDRVINACSCYRGSKVLSELLRHRPDRIHIIDTPIIMKQNLFFSPQPSGLFPICVR